MIEGVINLDKPPGLSSARCVSRVKRLLPRKTKIGHAGTLDPFATGVLLLLVGKATRRCEELMDSPKQYEATIKFGFNTQTDDPESPEIPFPHPANPPPDRSEMCAALTGFIGPIQQRPPAYSAMKVQGRRAYDLARSGQLVQLPPRTVMVYGIDLLDYEYPLLKLRIDCGRGTYIRSLARDIGEALNVGGYLTALRRTRVGDYHIDQAIGLDPLLQAGLPQLFQIP